MSGGKLPFESAQPNEREETLAEELCEGDAAVGPVRSRAAPYGDVADSMALAFQPQVQFGVGHHAEMPDGIEDGVEAFPAHQAKAEFTSFARELK